MRDDEDITMELTHEFELGGKKVIGRCTFGAINAFEEKAGVSISEAFQQLAEGKMKFSMIAIAIWAFINGDRSYRGDRPLPLDAIGAQVHLEGFNTMATPAMRFFMLTMPKADGKSDAQPEKKSSESIGVGLSESASGDGT
jgi:hypothetical protein